MTKKLLIVSLLILLAGLVGCGKEPEESIVTRPGSDGSIVQPSPISPTAPAPVTKETIVYVTPEGNKYHRDGCQHLRKNKIAMPLKEAKERYLPCTVCNPPEKE